MDQVSCYLVGYSARLQGVDHDVVVVVHCTEGKEQVEVRDMGKGREDMEKMVAVPCAEVFENRKGLLVEGRIEKHHWLLFQRRMMERRPLVLYDGHATNCWIRPGPQSCLQQKMTGIPYPEALSETARICIRKEYLSVFVVVKLCSCYESMRGS